MIRRMIDVVAGGIAVTAMLSGCLFAYDAAKTHVRYVNDSSQDVVVTIEGYGDEFPMPVASNGSYAESIPYCQGTSFRVETESDQLLGRIDKQACPNWTLTVNEDGTLEYVKD